MAERRNFTVGLLLDAPPGGARDHDWKKRSEYWDHSKRLECGSLVALVLISSGQFQVFLGTTTSTSADIGESAKVNANFIQLRISFFDAEIELMALRRQSITINSSTYAVLLDNSVMFESIHPFLRTLQEVEPTSIPFANIISHSGSLDSLKIRPPRYTRAPRFRYNLQCLARSDLNIPNLNVSDETSVALARQHLVRSSELDPSQADALIGALTREVSLIQGCALHIHLLRLAVYRHASPPGTGKVRLIVDKFRSAQSSCREKSFTGKEILRVLLSSKIRPIGVWGLTSRGSS